MRMTPAQASQSATTPARVLADDTLSREPMARWIASHAPTIALPGRTSVMALARLVEGGFLERTMHPQDRRRINLILTREWHDASVYVEKLCLD